MKMIIAVIQPFMLNKLTAELEEINEFPGMTITDVRGFGRKVDRDGNRFTALDPYKSKLRVEIVVRDDMAETIVDAIQTHARTGNHGDGKIFVLRVEDVVRIQTGETGIEAI
jgi:nitrogen regulatory protein P-II 1